MRTKGNKIFQLINEYINKIYKKINPGENYLIIIVSAIIGIAVGYSAILFNLLIEMVQHFALEQAGTWLLSSSYKFFFPIIPGIGGLIVGLITYNFAKEAKGHGVPEVMTAVARRGGIIRGRVAFFKATATSICIGTGGSTGREGPIVQIGAAIGSLIGQFFKFSGTHTKVLVGCGAAAGISAIFNAPIAGMFFATEIILSKFDVRTFSPIVISSVLANIITRLHAGNIRVFKLPFYTIVSNWEYLAYIGLGILSAFAGIAFIKMLSLTEEIFDKKIKIPEYIKPMIGGILLGCLALFTQDILGGGYSTMNHILKGNTPFNILLILLIIKPLATSLTLGSGGSGGIFAPSLFIGTITGAMVGIFMNTFFIDISAPIGAYALVGMAAVVSATTHAPITAILIVFEMTNNYHIILPLMLTSITAVLIARKIYYLSIYTEKIYNSGLNIERGIDNRILEKIKVRDIMTDNFIAVNFNTKISELIQLIKKSDIIEFPVIDNQKQLYGTITHQTLRNLDIERYDEIKDMPVRSIANQHVLFLNANESLTQALNLLSLRGIDLLPVVKNKYKRQVIGILTRENIMRHYKKMVIEDYISSRKQKQ